MGEFRMPSLGADMDAGTVLEWRVGPGDAVRRGDIVAVVKTDKADVEVEIFDEGVVGELLVPVGEQVPVGTPLATVVEPGAGPAPTGSGPDGPADEEPTEGEPVGAEPDARAAVEPAVASVEGRDDEVEVEGGASREAVPPPAMRPAPPPVAPRVPSPAPTRARVSPRARRLAAERGVDLEHVLPETPGEVVTGADVERRAAPGPAATAAGAESVGAAPVSPMRRAVAAAMARSKREIPHYYLEHRVDVSAALDWLRAENAERPVSERILPVALFARATALAVRAHPELNGFWVDDTFHPGSGVHLGLAVALRGGGLIAPAVLDADGCDVAELMAALRDLTARARSGRLRSSELSEATITLTSLGDRGVEVVHGVIYPPQVALVGVGAVVERPWAEHGRVDVRPVVALTLAADHRATDGHLGARFLARLATHLEHPEDL